MIIVESYSSKRYKHATYDFHQCGVYQSTAGSKIIIIFLNHFIDIWTPSKHQNAFFRSFPIRSLHTKIEIKGSHNSFKASCSIID